MTGYALTTQEVPTYRISKVDGLPLPELVDFRICDAGKKAILFIQEGGRFYRRHLDLARPGAGLWVLNPALRNATFTTAGRVIPESAEQPFERVERFGAFAVGVTKDMAAALLRVFRGQEMPIGFWPEQEGLHSAPDQTDTDHANAAD